MALDLSSKEVKTFSALTSDTFLIHCISHLFPGTNSYLFGYLRMGMLPYHRFLVYSRGKASMPHRATMSECRSISNRNNKNIKIPLQHEGRLNIVRSKTLAYKDGLENDAI